MSMSVTTLQPGYTNKGIKCQHCLKSRAKNNTFCSIASHHRTRVMKKVKKETFGSSKIAAIDNLTEEYSARNLIVGTILLFPEIQTLQDVLNMTHKIKTTQLKLYLINFHLAKENMLYTSMKMAHAITHQFQNLQEVKLVNKTHYISKLWNMDIILRNKKNQEFGLVIPRKYYLFQIQLSQLVTILPEINTLKNELLQEYGFNKYYNIPLTRDKTAKEVMEYAPGKNKYWEKIIQIWHNNKNTILSKLIKELTFSNINYPIYILRKSSITPVINSNQGWDIQIDTNHTRKPNLKFNVNYKNQTQFTLYLGWSDNFYQEPTVKII